MTKKLLLFFFLTGTMLICSTFVFSQQNQQNRSRSKTTSINRSQPLNMPRPTFITEDGRIDLSKLPDQFSSEMREIWTKADQDGDGFLNEEERQSVLGNQGGFPGGPMGGFNDFGKNELNSIVSDSINDEKQFDISKFNQLFAQKLTELDANSDGFLDQEELQTLNPFGRRPERRPFQQGNESNNRNGFPGGPMEPGSFQRPEFITEEGQIDLNKLPEAFPQEMRENWLKADQNGNGFLDQDEQRIQREQMRQGRSDFEPPQNRRARDQKNRSGNQSERRTPNERPENLSGRMPSGERFEGMPPEMKERMNEMIVSRAVSAAIREKSADQDSIEKMELQTAVEKSLNDIDLDGNQFLEEKELQTFNDSFPSMRPNMPPSPFDEKGRPENGPQSRRQNRPFQTDAPLIQGDVPDDSFAFIPKNPKFKFAFDITNKGKGESVAIADDYCLAKYPVTNADYKKFVDATNRKEYPKYWKEGTFPVGKENHPVLWVSIRDAQDYCQWLESQNPDWQFRLPTEAEWENAAAGPKKWKFPWGNNEKSNYETKNIKLTTRYNYNAVVAADYLSRQDQITAHYSDSDEEIQLDSILSINSQGIVSGWKNQDKSGFMFTDLFNELVTSGGFTTPVDQYPDGMSYYGCFDMAGNSFDWTSSQIEAQNGSEKGKMVHAIRGGSWYSAGKNCQTNYRGEGRNPENGYATVGFRVVAVKK